MAIRDTTRVETWRFFDPDPGGGDPDYTFGANRLLLQAGFSRPRFDVTISAQHVGLTDLPTNAFGPGAFGTGPLYYAQSDARRNPQQLYVKAANVRVRQIAPGLDVRVGRQGYTSGAEAATTSGGIEAVKRQRLDARLVGEFEWSLFQRAFDGVRVDWRRPSGQVTGVFFMPTQGGFARQAGGTLTRVRLAGLAGVVLPTKARPHYELQGFVWRYDDERGVTGRPDNTGLNASSADVAITTAGGSVIGAHPAGSGRADVLVWLAVQRGGWYGQNHTAFAFAAEGGYEWTQARWAPWLRAGWSRASGDDDPADAIHGTFFPMLPTMRRFSQTTVYATMNLQDGFVQVQVKPHASAAFRLDVHRLALSSSTDRWYAGSGATLRSGTNFGYVGRPSHGSTDLGTTVEVSGSYTISQHWSVNGFVGSMDGGRVVTGAFPGDRLWFTYVESGLRFDFPWR